MHFEGKRESNAPVADWLYVMKSWDERRISHSGTTATSWCRGDPAVGKRVC